MHSSGLNATIKTYAEAPAILLVSNVLRDDDKGDEMKEKPILKFILYAGLPIFLIYLLFRINLYMGFTSLAIYIALVVLMNRAHYYRIRGQVAYAKGELENAGKWFEKAISLKKAGLEMKVNYGFILLKQGQLDKANRVLQECVQQSRTEDEKNLAKSNLALVLWKKGELDQAVTMLREVIARYKTTAIYGSLGYLLIEKGDLEEALKFNLEAQEYNPENAIILDNLAHLYHLRGEMDKAGEIFQKLIEKDPRFPEAWYNYGRYLEDSGRRDEAIAQYQKAVSCSFSFNSTISPEQVQQRLDELQSGLSDHTTLDGNGE